MYRSILLILFILSMASTVRAEPGPRVAVIYYSRSGATDVMAREIVKHFGATEIRIKAPYYDGTGGFVRANREAWTEVENVEIQHEPVDLSEYDLVFLGSPIWWFRPAVPLIAFAKRNPFHGARVVLFNTFNSRFKSENIEKFRKIIEAGNGKWARHIYVRRGRSYDQLTSEQIREATRELLGATDWMGR